MKTKSFLKVILLSIIIFGILWYLFEDKSAVYFVQHPEVVLGLTVLFIAILLNGKIGSNLEEIRYEKLTEEEKIKFNTSKYGWYHSLMKKLTKAKPITQEKDILLDHDYDGIRELDNVLPPWWVYGFYLTIIFAVGYLSYYHILGGDNQTTEFEKEMAQARIEVEEYKKHAKDLVDINTVTLLTEESDLSKGKNIFESNCAVCHLADAGGSIGPNLTDQHWILGGGIKNVFNTVSEGGREGKGMIPWKATLKPSEIQQVASYILSLQGSTPAKPKAPEGEIWVEKE
ncbi:cbb3-type cytochrome c oxidase N-terminal domain-containing protein [Urechidicola croceus]|uniref:Cytochrome C oxidase subunit III n=1 Tax=Urechidicola croceus TaxID=1850246 RepID=A0A1D8P7X4_9FLAO|nr:cbb3-type cytochrome c oxidase N-terminal domain-containing protein [Urechidicola croceus]AOW20656.1 cytochrome C oxidase subunit III [Urechidicola croceus]